MVVAGAQPELRKIVCEARADLLLLPEIKRCVFNPKDPSGLREGRGVFRKTAAVQPQFVVEYR